MEEVLGMEICRLEILGREVLFHVSMGYGA
jgi:hypothetical protein